MCDEIDPLTPVEAAMIYLLPFAEYKAHARVLEASNILRAEAYRRRVDYAAYHESDGAAHVLADEVKALRASIAAQNVSIAQKHEEVEALRQEVQALKHSNEGGRKASFLVAKANDSLAELAQLKAEGAVPEALAKHNFVLQYGVNCPSKFLVRLPRPGAGSGGMDFLDYTKTPSKGGTCDIIAFGKTFAEAAANAVRYYEDARSTWLYGRKDCETRMAEVQEKGGAS